MDGQATAVILQSPVVKAGVLILMFASCGRKRWSWAACRIAVEGESFGAFSAPAGGIRFTDGEPGGRNQLRSIPGRGYPRRHDHRCAGFSRGAKACLQALDQFRARD